MNADSIETNLLKNVTIANFDAEYNLIKYIHADEIDIKNNTCTSRGKIIDETSTKEIDEKLLIRSNFNYNKINSLFSILNL